ncbi:MAG: exodeoxyribonuclease III [Micavibrio aeruginosavorus]|uniref:Exodeoxyribonuclease III n=1 Tax=Micavibrio aeruginosavorus TaxID=349221 RepID=A0A2W5N491_9BACT|nr:MAG: exodeoxyribonuclease III [Micavibrio aeruginosavorus]
MKILTWNINSVRLRAPIVVDVMRSMEPDIVCLQETKCPDELFPSKIFEDEGYVHQHFHGMKSYNGVAILSKIPFEGKDIHHRVGREDCRHIAARFKDFELHNLYIPAGGDIPDVNENDKFAHKLDFVDEMTRWFADRYSKDQKVIAVGDFNIAPLENDVWSHKSLLKVVSHTPIEVEKLTKMYGSLDWHDAIRHFVPEDQKCYTWWSYRNHDWKVSNRGRRLDHIWVTQPLVNALARHEIFAAARDFDKPSDHVPVMLELAT